MLSAALVFWDTPNPPCDADSQPHGCDLGLGHALTGTGCCGCPQVPGSGRARLLGWDQQQGSLPCTF